jgi:hypothetical protein
MAIANGLQESLNLILAHTCHIGGMVLLDLVC